MVQIVNKRPILSARRSHIEEIVAALSTDHVDASVARAATAWAWRERNAWDLKRRASGLFGAERRLERSGADKALRDALAAMEVGNDL